MCTPNIAMPIHQIANQLMTLSRASTISSKPLTQSAPFTPRTHPSLVQRSKSDVVHQTSVEYLESTKSVVEREARTILEGARSNLVQANIDISMWPYAVKHHCTAINLTQQLSGDRCPWDLRNTKDFTGKIIFWEDRKRPDSISGKMSPSSSQGVFLGYRIQSDHVWRDEYLAAHLDGLDYRLAS